jgi:hypothetical protein
MAIGAVGTRLAAEANLKWAIVNLTEPTMIAGKIVSGPVVFVHDDAKMARGEPCTSVHRFLTDKGVGEELVAFHCKPRWSNAPAKFTAATNRDAIGPRTLTEYQFAGDVEAHGVPARDKQAAAPHDMKGMHCADCAKDMKCGDGCRDCSDGKECQNGKSCKH